jgi:hypothetical protein
MPLFLIEITSFYFYYTLQYVLIDLSKIILKFLLDCVLVIVVTVFVSFVVMISFVEVVATNFLINNISEVRSAFYKMVDLLILTQNHNNVKCWCNPSCWEI